MKKRVLSLLLVTLILLPVCGVISAAGATSQAATAQPNEKINNEAKKTGTVGTQIVLLEPAGPTINAHVGDRMTIHLKLIRNDTGAAIPNALISGAVLYNKKWLTMPGGGVVTESNGEIGPLTMIIPDPRSVTNQIPIISSFVHLPYTVYVKATYAGDDTFAPSETVVYAVTLAP